MNYIICTQGRSRSSILMKCLKQLGAGFPEMWANPWYNQERDFNDYEALCNFVSGRSVDGHACMRINWGDLSRVCQTHVVKAKDFFDKCFPDAKYIYFTRESVTHSVEKMCYWASQQFDEDLDFIPKIDITENIIDAEIQNTAWELFFEKYTISPLRISCEVLREDVEGTCRKVLDFLNITYPENVILENCERALKINGTAAEKWYDAMICRYLEIMKDVNFD